MDRTVLLALVLAFAVVLVGLMALGWRARKRRQSAIERPATPPVTTGEALGEFAGKYVATTTADDPMDRIAVHDLGFRGSALVSVSTGGLVLGIVGSNDIWIPGATIRGIRRATWTIDRAVETDGMHLIAWTLGEKPVDSYLRMDDPAGFDAAVARITERQQS